MFNGSALVLDKPVYTTGTGQTFSVTRLDFLLSNIALRNDQGQWLEQTNWQAYLSAGAARLSCSVSNFPGGRYNRIKFHVGLREDLNHSNPAQFHAAHPLNPVLNGLHWNWAGGYVFLALEGHWRTSSGEWSGYAYHLGNDPMLMTVELPVNLDLDDPKALKLALDMARLLNFEFNENISSTHSRKGDRFAAEFKQRIELAFCVASGGSLSLPVAASPAKANTPQPHLAKLTPYRFSFSDQFPMPDLPRDNPLSNEGVELGRRLFSETKLSVNNSQSCASCHNSRNAFTDSGKRFSLGAEGQTGTRNSMPLFNLAWKKSFFWDGRAPSLRAQALMPIENPLEMHESLQQLTAKLNADTNYPAMFQQVFGSREITAERIGLALEQFMLTLASCDSKFDRALRNQIKLTPEESRGFELFMTEYDPRREQYGADCFHCHGGPLFQSQAFGNNGLDSVFRDRGLQETTGKTSDAGKFSVPSLRNVAVTAPYMHDGRFRTLEEVVEHYSTGLKRSSTLDPNLAKHPVSGIQLSEMDKKALVAFLKTLTDPAFEHPEVARAP